MPRMDESFNNREHSVGGASKTSKKKRRKVTIIKKRHLRDGSIEVTKKQVFGMTVT